MKPLIIIAGPTASGKSKLAVSLAHRINGAVISADSMQVYKQMNIGTAKITPSEMEGIKHYLIDILEPSEKFDITLFCQYAKQAIDEIYQNGQIPIICGGTGFYIQALLYDIEFDEKEVNITIRNRLEHELSELGNEVMYKRLVSIDPEYAQVIHANNTKRVLRALEYYEQCNEKFSEHNKKQQNQTSNYDFCYFVLTDERSILYDRIDQRIDQMIEMGLVEEVRRLKELGYNKSFVSMQGLGYKEILDYLDGECSLEESIRILKRDTRHFAKRQLTWFRRERDIIWLDKRQLKSEEELLFTIQNEMKDKGIYA